MKLIDFKTKGNVIKLYFGRDDCTEYWGDDWDDAPYEHNAGEVYEQFVRVIINYAFSTDYDVLEPSSDWHYFHNSPFSKEDMKNRKCPCLIIKNLKEDKWEYTYSDLLGYDSPDVLKIYFGDSLKDLEEKMSKFDYCVL